MPTDNHEYQTPASGTTSWHLPLNSNFQNLDTDMEVRDTVGNRDLYSPKNGAKFLATDSTEIYLGDGSSWNLIGQLGRTDSELSSYIQTEVQGMATFGETVTTQGGQPAFELDDNDGGTVFKSRFKANPTDPGGTTHWGNVGVEYEDDTGSITGGFSVTSGGDLHVSGAAYVGSMSAGSKLSTETWVGNNYLSLSGGTLTGGLTLGGNVDGASNEITNLGRVEIDTDTQVIDVNNPTSGHSLQYSWQSDDTKVRFMPKVSGGSYNANDTFGYNFSNTNWEFDAAPLINGEITATESWVEDSATANSALSADTAIDIQDGETINFSVGSTDPGTPANGTTLWFDTGT